MNCDETRRLIDADVDGELDLVRHLEIEAHLRTCEACARLAESRRARRVALREALPRYRAPAALEARVRAAVRAEAPPAARATRRWPVGAIAGAAAAAALIFAVGVQWGGARARAGAIFEEAISSHVRSLQGSHLTDVASSEQHTVKPWFAGKVDFSPPVVDLASAGFPLEGGRLERLDGRPAAALVFRRRQHAINLFIVPAGESAAPSSRVQRDGYSAIAWSQAGFVFFAVSEIPESELERFAAEVSAQIGPR